MAANAANYATAQQDKKNLYDNKLIPWAKVIAQTFNEQVFASMGYRLEFRPGEMEIYQQDENDRAAAFKVYVDAGIKQSIAAEMMGLDLPEGVEYEDLDPEEPEPMEVVPQVVPPEEEIVEDEKPVEKPESKNIDPLQLGRELSIWQS